MALSIDTSGASVDIGRLTILPGYTFPADPAGATVAPRETLNKQRKIRDVQLSVCALNEPLRFGYGLNRVGALMLMPIEYQSKMLMPFIIARGEIDGVESLEFENVAVPTSNPRTLYLGTATQAIDPWLAAAWAANTPRRTYADTLSNPPIAWGVLKLSHNRDFNPTNLTVQARMLKVSLTSGGAKTYTTNPAFWLADFIENTAYGRGETLDWTSVAAVAAVNDQAVGAGKRRGGGVMFDTVRSLDEIETTLAQYAGCWVVREGGIVRLIPDAPAASVFAFTNAPGSANYFADTIEIDGATRENVPTVVTVKWTDTTVKPWREAQHTEYAPGVQDIPPTTPWREQVVSMPGIQDASWARREAIRRLNEYITSDQTVHLQAFGEAIQLRRGDVVTVTDSGGYAAKPFRTKDVTPRAPGVWDVMLKEYDPAIYSDAVATGPTFPDTTLPSPSSPPAITGLTLTEDVYQSADGRVLTRILALWTNPGYAFHEHYLVEVFGTVAGNDQLVDSGRPVSIGWTSGPLPEGRSYAVHVTEVSDSGAPGTPAVERIFLTGKVDVPSDLVSISATVNGAAVALTWVLPADFDLSAVELRWGATTLGTDTAAYLAATLLNRVAMPALSYETSKIPTGTWRVFAKLRDQVRNASFPLGHESANPVYVDVTIAGAAGGTPPPAPVIGDDLEPSGVALVNMTLGSEGCWVTDMGDTWASRFPLAMTNYPDPIASYHTSGTSSLTTTAIDLGVAKKATFKWTGLAYTDIKPAAGTAIAYIETSLDGSSYTRQAAGLSWNGTARYIRGAIETLTTGTMRVCNKGRFQVQVDGVEAAIVASDKQNRLATRRFAQNYASGNATGNIGPISVSLIGTNAAGASQTFATNFFAAAARLTVDTPSGSINQGTSRTSTTVAPVLRGNQYFGGFVVTICMGIHIIKSDSRWAAGLRTSASTPAFNVDPSTFANSIHFGQDSADANIHLWSRDGATLTNLDLGASWPRPTQQVDWYEFEFSCLPNADAVDWIIRNRTTGLSLSGSIIATMPSKTTPLYPYNYLTNGPTVTTAATIAHGNMTIETFS